jgi:hypothetical protein
MLPPLPFGSNGDSLTATGADASYLVLLRSHVVKNNACREALFPILRLFLEELRELSLMS